MTLTFGEYRKRLDLDHPRLVEPDPQWEQSLRPVLAELGITIPHDASIAQMVDVLHGILAPIEQRALDEHLVKRIEALGAGLVAGDQLAEAHGLPVLARQSNSRYPATDSVSLWVGDITRIKADAIVNAANKEMLGCQIPNHRCIDNAIHSAAGPRLRDDCATIIETQQTIEPVGAAKLTHAYALPATYVVHTVGPQLVPGAAPTELEQAQLASCYKSCVDVAAELDTIATIAFCGISTGLFSFPHRPAARIALTTIAQWVEANPGRFERVIIDCFTPADAAVSGLTPIFPSSRTRPSSTTAI